MWRFEGGEEGEAGLYEVLAFGRHHLATPDDVRAEAGEHRVVAVWDLEHGEPPESPAMVAFLDGLLQAGVGEGDDTEADDEQSWDRTVVAERHGLGHTLDVTEGPTGER